MRRVLFLLLTLCAVAALYVSPASASSGGDTIGTIGLWSGGSVEPFGYPDTATYGQVITVPGSDATLSSFTFELQVPTTATFRAGVFAWDGSKAVGAPLWQSGDMTTATSGWGEVTVDTGGVPVVPGAQYVIYFTTSESSGSGLGEWGLVGDDYSGGGFVYNNNGSDFGALTTTPWQGFGTQDLAFEASFGGAKCWNVAGDDGCAQLPRAAVCSSTGQFDNVLYTQVFDPTSPYYGEKPAAYVQGYGLMCSLTDLVTYGGDPSQYVDAGYRVDEAGTRTPAEMTDLQFGALYEYFAKKS
jgi:hypothetical protein